jgi:hypothetical protein
VSPLFVALLVSAAASGLLSVLLIWQMDVNEARRQSVRRARRAAPTIIEPSIPRATARTRRR